MVGTCMALDHDIYPTMLGVTMNNKDGYTHRSHTHMHAHTRSHGNHKDLQTGRVKQCDTPHKEERSIVPPQVLLTLSARSSVWATFKWVYPVWFHGSRVFWFCRACACVNEWSSAVDETIHSLRQGCWHNSVPSSREITRLQLMARKHVALIKKSGSLREQRASFDSLQLPNVSVCVSQWVILQYWKDIGSQRTVSHLGKLIKISSVS